MPAKGRWDLIRRLKVKGHEKMKKLFRIQELKIQLIMLKN
jgi:hypothetical protein